MLCRGKDLFIGNVKSTFAHQIVPMLCYIPTRSYSNVRHLSRRMSSVPLDESVSKTPTREIYRHFHWRKYPPHPASRQNPKDLQYDVAQSHHCSRAFEARSIEPFQAALHLLRQAFSNAISTIMIRATVTICLAVPMTEGMQQLNSRSVSQDREAANGSDPVEP